MNGRQIKYITAPFISMLLFGENDRCIVDLLCEGYNYKEIAAKLKISVKCVRDRTHVICRNNCCRSTEQLCFKYAIERNREAVNSFKREILPLLITTPHSR